MRQLVVFLFIGFTSARLSDDKCKEYYKKSLADDQSLIKEFPHMGLLGYVNDNNITYDCLATLISESYVISAAHCITGSLKGNPKHVLLGTQDPNQKGENYKLVDVLEIIMHPNYTARAKTHNLVLIKFSPPVTPNDYIRPGCLYTKNVKDNQLLVDLLWGFPDYNGLYKVNSSIVPILSCKKDYGDRPKIDEHSHLCMKRNYGNKFELHIGGASHAYEDGIAKIVAIDNFGPTLPTSKYPDVSTKIYNYLDWIEKNVWKT